MFLARYKKKIVDLVMLQISKKLEGHNALWSFVRPFVRSLLLAYSQKQLKIGH